MVFPKKKKENKTTHNIEVGTLYDMNKNLVEKNIPDLTEEELNNKKELFISYLKDTNNYYYMLLCNDKKDYTILRLAVKSDDIRLNKLTNILVDECLTNRGKVKSIELTENKDAVEIWLSIDGESYCYYFFPYDAAIIEC